MTSEHSTEAGGSKADAQFAERNRLNHIAGHRNGKAGETHARLAHALVRDGGTGTFLELVRRDDGRSSGASETYVQKT